MGHLHYLSAFTELPVADLEASARWYESVLGFQRIASYRLARGRAIHLRRGEGQDILLREAGSDPTSRVYFATDSDLAGRAEAKSTPGSGPDDPATLDFTDPDGHVLRFFPREIPHAIGR